MNASFFSYRIHHLTSPRGFRVPALQALVVIFLMLVPALAQAQSFERLEERTSNVPSYFYHVQPGQATMQVEVIGAVRSPGLYVVDARTTVNQLLALSGGPLLDVRPRASNRTIVVRLMRSQQGNSPAFEARVEGAIASFENAPQLAQGDVLNVEVIERRRFTWRDVFTVVNTLALFVLSVERITNL